MWGVQTKNICFVFDFTVLPVNMGDHKHFINLKPMVTPSLEVMSITPVASHLMLA
jgi:hypothetical protein